MSKLPGKYLDVAAAVLLLLGSLLLVLVAYQKVYPQVRPASLALGSLKDGSSGFLLYRETACVGVLHFLQERLELVRLRAETKIITEFQGREAPLRMEAEGFFNPLGQLVRSHLDFSFLTARFVVTTTDVHPIHVQILVTSAGVRTERSIDLPGPIILRRQESSGLSLDYPRLTQLIPASLGGSFLSLPGNSAISLREAKSGAACPKDELGKLNIAELSLPALPFFSQIQTLIQTGKVVEPL